MAVKCFVCDGRGADFAWCDRDPIEGYKMARKHTCIFCDGVGTIDNRDSRIPAIRAYLDTIKTIEKECISLKERREAERAKLVRSAKSKLTKEEMEALGVTPDSKINQAIEGAKKAALAELSGKRKRST